MSKKVDSVDFKIAVNRLLLKILSIRFYSPVTSSWYKSYAYNHGGIRLEKRDLYKIGSDTGVYGFTDHSFTFIHRKLTLNTGCNKKLIVLYKNKVT